ncbi:MAG TPA: MBL fold metallo-hydrolase [Steroidobacteraceae bacterium]
MRLTFCGAAQQVTGSSFLFETSSSRFLVDCGMFQGARDTRARNLAPFAFDPYRLDFVILTHAHIDHSGLLPRLQAAGFRGPVYATGATGDLVSVLLPDSAHLQRMEAERAARHGRDFRPAYGLEEARAVLQQLRIVGYDHVFEPASGVRARLRDAGHILGSAIVELWLEEAARTRKVVVSGDLGQPGRPIVRDPSFIAEADVLLLESTYGNRDHKPLAQTLDELVQILEHALGERRGVVVVPAFAVGRTQEFLYYLNQLSREGRIRGPNVFVDSPMAAAVSAITARHFDLFDEEARRLAGPGPFTSTSLRVRYAETQQDSMALNRLAGGAIIIAASGMCDGGRIRHHLLHRLPDPGTTVLFIGYQAAGTLGRRIVDRAPSVRIFGEEVAVRARIATLGGFSAHADQSTLLAWLAHFAPPPRQLCLVHGEPQVMRALAARIEQRCGVQAHLPAHGEAIEL